MTRGTGIGIVALVLAGSTATAFLDAQSDQVPRRQVVNVNASCPAQGPQAQIAPFQITAAFGDTIAWNLNGPPSSSVSITPKAGTDWPFTATVHSGTSVSDAVTGGLRESVPARGGRPARTFVDGDTVRYDVTVTCADGRQTVIDPDIVIRGRS